MFGGWEILILAVIVLIFVGYKKLPEIGRSAGEGARQLKEGAQKHVGTAKVAGEEQAAKATAYIDEHTPSAADIGRTAGKHVREYRELKEEVMGIPEPAPKADTAPEPTPDAPPDPDAS